MFIVAIVLYGDYRLHQWSIERSSVFYTVSSGKCAIRENPSMSIEEGDMSDILELRFIREIEQYRSIAEKYDQYDKKNDEDTLHKEGNGEFARE